MTTGSRVSITCSRRSVQKTQINYDKLTSGGLQKDCRRWRRSVKTVQKWFKNWFQVDYSTTPSPDCGDIVILVFFFTFMSNSMFLATNVARASVLCPIYARRYRPDRSCRLGRLLGRLRQTFRETMKRNKNFRNFVDLSNSLKIAITVMLALTDAIS